MIEFKFLQENKYNIECDPLYHLTVHQNMILGIISYRYRMNLTPIEYHHQFHENGIMRGIVVKDIWRHDQFESRHVRIQYSIYDRNGMNNHSFHLDEQVFESVMRRYENL